MFINNILLITNRNDGAIHYFSYLYYTINSSLKHEKHPHDDYLLHLQFTLKVMATQQLSSLNFNMIGFVFVLM